MSSSTSRTVHAGIRIARVTDRPITKRVQELRALHLDTHAELVSQCTDDERCLLRMCTQCSVRMWESALERAKEVLRTMADATRVRITAWSKEPGELPSVWANLRRGLGALIRPGHLRRLKLGLGVIRIVEHRTAKHGAVCVDLVLDIQDLDIERLERNVLRLPGCGQIEFEIVRKHVKAPHKLLVPSTADRERWYPTPGAMSLGRLSETWRAQHRRRLIFVWASKERR